MLNLLTHCFFYIFHHVKNNRRIICGAEIISKIQCFISTPAEAPVSLYRDCLAISDAGELFSPVFSDITFYLQKKIQEDMAKLLGLDKVAVLFRIIRENGGIFRSLRTLYRTDDLKCGTLIGEDKYGNRYYENNMYFVGRNRWVIYADKVGLNYDGSQVPPEWFGWLHYKTDLPPHKDPSRPKYKWMMDHTQNMSGTDQAYMPYSTTRPKIEPWRPPQ